MLHFNYAGPSTNVGRATTHPIEVYLDNRKVATGISKHVHANSATIIIIDTFESELLSSIEELFHNAESVIFNYS